MIEQGLYFGLGCAITGLIALGFAPVLWARALRLTRHRLQVQIPVSMQEILADRDQLRAEFAVERRKIEQEMDRVRAGKATDMAELGRRAVRAVALADELAAVRRIEAAQDAEIATLQRETAEAGAQIGTLRMALHDMDMRLEQRGRAFEALRREHQALEALAEERRTTVAGLSTRAMGLEMTIEDAARARAAIERRLEAAKQQTQLLSDERDLLSTRIDVMQSSKDNLRQRLAAEMAQVATHADTIAALHGDLDKARGRVRMLEAELVDAARAIEDAKEREKGIHLRTSLQAEKARGDGHAVLDQLESARSENAALRGALEAARRRASAPSGVGPEPEATGDAMLRTEIHELGLALAAMTSAQRQARGESRASEPIRPTEVASALEPSS